MGRNERGPEKKSSLCAFSLTKHCVLSCKQSSRTNESQQLPKNPANKLHKLQVKLSLNGDIVIVT